MVHKSFYLKTEQEANLQKRRQLSDTLNGKDYAEQLF